MPDADPVLLGRTDAIARIVLNRPAKRNALGPDLLRELSRALAQTAADPQVRVVAISGAGKDFCAGADLASVRGMAQAGPLENIEDARALGEVFIAIRKHPRPVVALVQGRALAGGCGLATACDVVLASESARFGYPEVNIGFVPAMVSAIVRRCASEKRAFDLLASGDPIAARTALDLGLITRVFADESFENESDNYLAKLAGKSASALAMTKNALYHADGMSFEAAIEAGAHLNALARATEDCRRGMDKFLRKE